MGALNVQVCVPWRAGDDGRAEGWARVARYWQAVGYRVVTADSDPDRPFNRGQARNRAAAGTWDVAIFADACLLPAATRSHIAGGVRLAAQARALVHGHNAVIRLSAAGTQSVIRGASPARAAVERRTGRRTPGGILIVSRALYDRVGGWDEDFEGWGGEDGAFLARCLRHARWVHVTSPVYHLWHAHSDRDLTSEAYARNRQRSAAAWAGR